MDAFKLSQGKSGFGYCQIENDVYLAGGNDGEGILTCFEKYRVQLDGSATWVGLPDMREPRDELCLSFSPDYKYIMAIGGYNSSGKVLSSCEVFSLEE